jgi:hypothetical protein
MIKIEKEIDDYAVCHNCWKKKDVKRIIVKYDGLNHIVPLCKKCRKILFEKLKTEFLGSSYEEK